MKPKPKTVVAWAFSMQYRGDRRTYVDAMMSERFARRQLKLSGDTGDWWMGEPIRVELPLPKRPK